MPPQIAEIEESPVAFEPTGTPADRFDLTPFRAGPGPETRLDRDAQSKLAKAEKLVADAQNRADQIRQDAVNRQLGIEALRGNLGTSQARLVNLRAVDCDARLQEARKVVTQLFGRNNSPGEAQTLSLAMHDLKVWPELKALLPVMLAEEQATFDGIKAELAALESGK